MQRTLHRTLKGLLKDSKIKVTITTEQDKVRWAEFEKLFKNWRVNQRIYIDEYYPFLVSMAVSMVADAPRKPLRQIREHGVPALSVQKQLADYSDIHCTKAFLAKMAGLPPQAFKQVKLTKYKPNLHGTSKGWWTDAIEENINVEKIDQDGIISWLSENTNILEVM